jgi:hypothetical protein
MVCGSTEMALIMLLMSKVYQYVLLQILKRLFMKNSARVPMVWLDAIFTLLDVDGIMLCPCLQWINRVGSGEFNLLETLGLLLLPPIDNSNN